MSNKLTYLSLASKSGRLVIGAERCEKALKKGKARMLLLSSDAGSNTENKILKFISNDVNIHKSSYSKFEIAHAIGSSTPVSVLVLIDDGLMNAYLKADE